MLEDTVEKFQKVKQKKGKKGEKERKGKQNSKKVRGSMSEKPYAINGSPRKGQMRKHQGRNNQESKRRSLWGITPER